MGVKKSLVGSAVKAPTAITQVMARVAAIAVIFFRNEVFFITLSPFVTDRFFFAGKHLIGLLPPYTMTIGDWICKVKIKVQIFFAKAVAYYVCKWLDSHGKGK